MEKKIKKERKNMNKKMIIYPIVIILISAISFFVYGAIEKQAAEKDKNDDKKNIKIPVEIISVAKGDIEAYYTTTGTIEAEKEANIVSKSTGIVTDIYFEEGDFVKKGQIMAILENEKQKIDLKRSEISLKITKNDLDRTEELYRKKLTSKEMFEKLQFDYESKKYQYELTKLELENCNIVASISGVIASRKICIGNMVSYNANAFRVVNFNSLFVNIFVPEGELSKLKINQKVNISIDAIFNEENSNKYVLGKIERINPVVDPSSGTAKVTIKIKKDKNSKEVKPGMFSRIHITYDTHKNALLIPKDAVKTVDNDQTVFLVKDSIVFKKYIKTGFSNKNFIEVLEGINLEDSLVTVGINTLKDSSKVEIVQW